MRKRPTMVDVAREAGVGLKTVSRVVNSESGVSPELADRVRAAIATLGFRRNDMASNLRAGIPAASIGLLIEDLGNPFYSAIARGIEMVVAPKDYALLTASSAEDPQREQELLFELCRRRVNGVIVVPIARDHQFLQHEIDLGLQVVFLDRPVSGIAADNVLLDNLGGALAATRYLLGRGHRRIAVIGAELELWTMTERVAGYKSALVAAGIPVDPKLLRHGPRTVEAAVSAAQALLDSENPPTAFFALNNLMTVGVLTELRRRELQMDVVGFDDIDVAPLLSQPLTVVSYDPAELGRRAAELLLERLNGRFTPQQVVVPTMLKSYEH